MLNGIKIQMVPGSTLIVEVKVALAAKAMAKANEKAFAVKAKANAEVIMEAMMMMTSTTMMAKMTVTGIKQIQHKIYSTEVVKDVEKAKGVKVATVKVATARPKAKASSSGHSPILPTWPQTPLVNS